MIPPTKNNLNYESLYFVVVIPARFREKKKNSSLCLG